MNTLVLISAACLLFAADGAGAKPDPPKTADGWLDVTRPELLQILSTAEANQPATAFMQLEQERSATMLALVGIVNSRKTDSFAEANRRDAIKLLGQYRSAQGVTCLLKHLETRSNVVWNGAPLELYPAAEALREIGEPAIYKIQDFVARDLSEKQLLLLAHVIHGAGGKEVGQYRLELTLRDYVAEKRARAERDEKQYSPDQKTKNLERMIELFKTLDFRQRVR